MLVILSKVIFKGSVQHVIIFLLIVMVLDLECFLALEMSKSDVPQKLTNLWERYKLEQERAGKLVFKNSGFAGTGFKFDDAEKQMDKDRKKMQQAALGLNVSNH